MNKFKTAILVSLSIFSLSTFAATELTTASELNNYAKIGKISISGQNSFEDAISKIEQEASQLGAKYYYISALDVPGDNSQWKANAILLK